MEEDIRGANKEEEAVVFVEAIEDKKDVVAEEVALQEQLQLSEQIPQPQVAEAMSEKLLREKVAAPPQDEASIKGIGEQGIEESQASKEEIQNAEIVSVQLPHKEEAIVASPQPSETPLLEVGGKMPQDERKIEHMITPSPILRGDVAKPIDRGGLPVALHGENEFLPEEVMLLGEQGETENEESLREGLRRKVLTLDEITQLLQQPFGIELIVSLMGRAIQETTASSSLEPIDIFSAKESIEKKKTNISEVVVVQQGETIVIGQERKQELDATESRDTSFVVEPITTIDAFSKALDVIIKLIGDGQYSIQEIKESNGDDPGDLLDAKEAAKTSLTTQQEKLSEISMRVSEEILTFIDNGVQVLRRLERRQTRENKEALGVHTAEAKQMVRIVSEQKEIIIELETLKKLLEMRKMKQQIMTLVFFQENQTAVEELGLHTMKFYEDDTLAFWLIYKIVVFSLASVEEKQLLTFDRVISTHNSSQVLHA